MYRNGGVNKICNRRAIKVTIPNFVMEQYTELHTVWMKEFKARPRSMASKIQEQGQMLYFHTHFIHNTSPLNID